MTPRKPKSWLNPNHSQRHRGHGDTEKAGRGDIEKPNPKNRSFNAEIAEKDVGFETKGMRTQTQASNAEIAEKDGTGEGETRCFTRDVCPPWDGESRSASHARAPARSANPLPVFARRSSSGDGFSHSP